MSNKRGNNKKKIKVAVGISGGVDSAVAAALLLEEGYEVIGVHLYCYDDNPACTADDDRTSAVRVARHLGIPRALEGQLHSRSLEDGQKIRANS